MLLKIKEAYLISQKWFWALPLWKRTILTSIIGALGGSSLIGFINKYALYYHAICQGIRIPVEGVEYLDLAVTLLSFSILLSSIFGTIITYNLLNLASDFLVKTTVPSGNLKMKRIFNIIYRTIILSLAIKLFLTAKISETIIKIASSILSNSSVEAPYFHIASGVSIILLSTIIFYLILTSRTKASKIRIVKENDVPAKKELKQKPQDNSPKKAQEVKVATLSIVALGIFSISLSLFNQKIYGSFLHKIRYGGKVPIIIEYRKADNTEESISGRLLIRTNKSITVERYKTGNIEEVPSERVSKITFVKSD